MAEKLKDWFVERPLVAGSLAVPLMAIIEVILLHYWPLHKPDWLFFGCMPFVLGLIVWGNCTFEVWMRSRQARKRA